MQNDSETKTEYIVKFNTQKIAAPDRCDSLTSVNQAVFIRANISHPANVWRGKEANLHYGRYVNCTT